jgi:hypothetical protein
MNEPIELNKGDIVYVTFGGKCVEATVMLASPNNYSLVLAFDAFLDGYVGAMAVAWNKDERQYKDLFQNKTVIISNISQS